MTFLAPLFLLAALAGIIPIAQHMINRQKAVEAPFPSLRFLQISVQKTRRRKRINDLLLMLIRVAALALVALGLAKPTVTSLRALLGGASSAVVIVLDNSSSMGVIDGERMRQETAVAAAGQILDELGDRDQVGLLLTSGPRFPELGRLDRTQERVRQILAQCRTSYERADLAAQIRKAREMLLPVKVPSKVIYVITDMQKLSWEQFFAAPGKTEKGGKSEKGEKGGSGADAQAEIPVVVVDCHRAPKPNVAVEGMALEVPAPTAGAPLMATVRLLNASAAPQQRLVDLVIDGAKQQTSPAINLPSLGRGKYEFVFALGRGGIHHGEFRLVGDDGSKFDDRRFFTMEIDQEIPVALVRAKQEEIPYLDDAYYLQRAFSSGRAGRASAVLPVMLTAADLLGEPLEKYRVVFCVNLPAPEGEAADRLRNYVANGGNLVWIAGENVDPTAYNRMNEAAGGQLLPAPLGAVRAAASQAGRDAYHVNSLDKTHPALAHLVDPPSLYESILVTKHVEIEAKKTPDARVLAALDDGQPLLVQRNVGRGKALLLGSGAHVRWSNLPLRPIFLPLLLRLTLNLAGVEAAPSQVLAGNPLTLSLNNQPQPVEVEVVRPGGETIRLKTESREGGKGQEFRYPDTYDIGIYKVRVLDPAHPRETAFAVNFDPEEADPTTLDRQELQERFGPAKVVFAENPDDLSTTFAALREGRSLWSPLLIATLVALVLESFVSNRLGGAKRAEDEGHPPPAIPSPSGRGSG